MKRGKRKQTDRPRTRTREQARKKKGTLVQTWFPGFGWVPVDDGPYTTDENGESTAGRGRGRKNGGA